MSEPTPGPPMPIPEVIPSVNAVEFAAAMTASWERQTDRVIRAIAWLMLVGALMISGANWGVQYRLSHSAILLESTRANVRESQAMIKSMQEDRHTDETRFRTLLAAVALLGQRADQLQRERGKP